MLICMLAILGIYMLIKGVSKVQCCNFMSLNPVASGSCYLVALYQLVWMLAILVIPICIDISCTGLTLIPICVLAILAIPIYINASCTSFTLILICMLAMLDIYMLIKGISKVQYYRFMLLNLILPIAAILWLYTDLYGRQLY